MAFVSLIANAQEKVTASIKGAEKSKISLADIQKVTQIDFDMDYAKFVSSTVFYIRAGSKILIENTLNKNDFILFENLIHDIKPGDKIFFENIKYKDQLNKEGNSNNIALKVTE
jgi:hypothetical protein